MTLAASYDPTQFESRLYQQWEASGVFKPRGEGEPYSILLPPPNVTGTLHMGHAFQHTLMDALVRYHRMRGFDTLWQMGSDHAGIATEMVVARNLALQGQGETRDSLGRDGFIDKVWEWKGQSGDTIERQMRRLGTSGDWSRSVFTMDPMPAEAVVEAFVRLHEQGLIYRGQRLVNWDPVLKTAISDLEVVNQEEDGFLWSISYPLTDGSGSLTVATTRPETLLGDSAVMVHPDDERYAHLVGKTVRLPLCDRQIPIIADSYVDREFGTGVVKVTPAHDFNDYQVGQRHSLPLINIFTPEAAVNDEAPEKYRGLDRYAARKAVLADLEAAGLLIETKPHKLQVPRGDRSGQAIEPYLTDQWFVKMDALAKRGMELVENGAVEFVPPNWINTYRHWMENIQDWCISRQLWWGHRIPAWYDEAGNVYVGRNEEEACRRAGFNPPNPDGTQDGAAKDGGLKPALRRDDDVLETWFSSALWPFSTMGWPNQTRMSERGFDKFVPSSVLVTGFDIIFFWVARMIMMTDHFVDQVPFKHVYMTGLVRDSHGQKMSKSKGNVLDPLDLIDGISADALVAKRISGLMNPKTAPKIEKATRKEFPDGIPAFGADALRFTMAALAGPGRDIKFDLGRAEGYKNFCNKLWNATRFVLMNTEDFLRPSPAGRGAGGEGSGRDISQVRIESTGVAGSQLSQREQASSTSPNPHPNPSPAGRGASMPHPHTDAERWILARLAIAADAAERHFADYRFDLLAQNLYEFAWSDFCDWFVELAKPALNGDDAGAAASTRHTLLFVLERLLSLLHPLIPFVTEELWLQVAPRLRLDEDTIMLRPYPQAADFAGSDFADAEGNIEWLKSMVSALRRVRSELNVAPAKQVNLLLSGGDDTDRQRIGRFEQPLRFLTRVERIGFIDDANQAPAAATAVVGDLKLLVPLAGLVDLDAERTRLAKELKRVATEIGKCEAKLASDRFVGKAPPAVVEQERTRLSEWTRQHEALGAQREKLG